MASREQYSPGPAAGAHIEKEGETWTLVLVRDLRHPPEKVWDAITDPAQLSQWAPYDSDGNLGRTGAKVNLTTVGAPKHSVSETTVSEADPPNLLVFGWGHISMRWELAATDHGTRLTLWTKIPRKYMAMGAAGWHVCFDVMDRMLSGDPIGRTTGPDAMQFDGWQRLHREYSELFGIEMPTWVN